MFLVALTRWGSAARPPSPPEPALLEAELAALGPLLGKAPYELRLALSAPLPVVLLATSDADSARRLLASLRSREHGAVACDAASVGASADMLQPKTFELGGDALSFETPGVGKSTLVYSDVLALLVATHAREEESTTERSEKKMAVGRALLSGGLIRSKTTTVTERSASLETERVLYVLCKSGTGHAFLRETRLHYTGLGARMGKSTTESFTTLLAVLRERMPGARYDDRLLKRRAASSLSVSKSGSAQTVSASNASEVDTAAHLLAVAFLQGQA
ncbi:MAG: hypothetical protein IPI67_34550 [Myxococcales bacterium]|nr:hypothetical protein [Myxococcales bacterium]